MTPDTDFMLNKLKKVRDEADPSRHPAVYKNSLIEAIAEIERLRAAAAGAERLEAGLRIIMQAGSAHGGAWCTAQARGALFDLDFDAYPETGRPETEPSSV